MKKYSDVIVPCVGVHLDLSPLFHLFRDVLFGYLLWLSGFRGFQLAFAVMLISGFWEAGNGICYDCNAKHTYFDFLDFLPSVPAGYVIVGLTLKTWGPGLLGTLFTIYIITIAVLYIANLILRRPFTIDKD